LFRQVEHAIAPNHRRARKTKTRPLYDFSLEEEEGYISTRRTFIIIKP